ncbi:hypothetical protein H0A36_24785 [Endozoicomonas sp. SM1973]|uniref:Uncharacterized protein n=1 Tax=Spartinivicinus marinus TaxID=2994442 RepID=A0A853I8R3_9GAMM|nr:hypothetical protein [Spartinivicinus marinus]MCX4024941.1 hypothetical protein [Spartinivicinus marinus]NYZ69239.1 hypothetical protein [Spartinivicinus marinus]
MKKLALATLVAAATQTAMAVPTFKTCDTKIKAPELGTGVLFGNSCDHAYVLPPAIGDVTVTSVAPNANLEFCNSIDSLTESNKILVSYIEDEVKNYKENQNEIEKIVHEKMFVIAKELAPLEAQNEIITSKLEEQEKLRTEILKAIRTAKTEYIDCKESSVDAATECKEELAIFKEERSKLRDVRRKETTLINESYDISLQIKTLTKKMQAEQDKADQLKSTSVKSLAEINSLRKIIMDTYKEFALKEGMTAGITYALPWNELVNEYQRLNPGINFQAIPIKDSSFKFNTLQASSLETAFRELPGALSVSVAGKHSGLFVEPNTLEAPQKLGDQSDKNIPFTDSISGQVRLSLMGACPLLDDEGNIKENASKELHSYLMPNAVLEYEVKVNRGYKAEYNLYRMYEKYMKTKTKGGGFIRHKKKTKGYENKIVEEGFTIEFLADGGEFNYTPEEQARIASEVKSTLINRAVKHIATFVDIRKMVPELQETTITGAGVFAQTLAKNCKFKGSEPKDKTEETTPETTTNGTAELVATPSGETSTTNNSETTPDSISEKNKAGYELACQDAENTPPNTAAGNNNEAAGEVAGELAKTAASALASGNYYAAAGAAAAAIFIDTFASSSTKVYFKETLDVNLKEDIKGVSFIDRVKTVSFAPKLEQ